MEGGVSPSLRVIGETTLQVSETHSSRLMPTIDRLLRETSLPAQKIQGIAVGLGPGSFTGLRIAVSTVKGLAFALRVPVVGAPTLDALANNIRYASTQVCPVLDARKKEVYAALFRGDGEGQLKKISEDWVLSPEDLCSRISETTVLVGNGTEVYGEIFKKRLGLPGPLRSPGAFLSPGGASGPVEPPRFSEGGDAGPLRVYSDLRPPLGGRDSPGEKRARRNLVPGFVRKWPG